MTDVPKVKSALETYYRLYNLSGEICLSEPYKLKEDWTVKSFPNASDCGCYVFYDKDFSLLYIGKASLKSTIGRRAASYFNYDKTDNILTTNNKEWEPEFLQTIKVNNPWEAPSLEEYLIHHLQPITNSRGILKKDGNFGTEKS